MKRALTLISLLVLAAAIIGCGSGNSDSSATTGGSAPKSGAAPQTPSTGVNVK